MSSIEKLKSLVRFWVLSPQVEARYVTDIEWARDDCAEALAPFIAELEVEFEALRADAARYRWLRDSGWDHSEAWQPAYDALNNGGMTPAEVDAEIDAAMESRP